MTTSLVVFLNTSSLTQSGIIFIFTSCDAGLTYFVFFVYQNIFPIISSFYGAIEIVLLLLLRATAVPAGILLKSRIAMAILSVRPAVRPSRPGTDSRPGEIETPGLHHMIA